jgi:hypothetical protein
MSLITNKTQFEPGDKPTAIKLNAPYDSLETALVGPDNTRNGWMSRAHNGALATNVPTFNRCWNFENTTTSTHSYTSTSYVDVSQGGNTAEIVFNVSGLEAGEVWRFGASIMVANSTVTTDYDYVGSDEGKPNYYAFTLVSHTYDSGGSPGTTTLGEWGYSFTSKKSGTLASTLTPAVSNTINWQGAHMSTIMPITSALSGGEMTKIVLRCKVQNSSNTLKLERYSLWAIRHIR